MESKMICDECGVKCYRAVISVKKDGTRKRICEGCNEKTQLKNMVKLDVPGVIKWVGKCAKQGDKLLFLIPQGQRHFFKHGEKYIIVVRKLK